MAGHVARLLERNPNSTLGKLSGGAVQWNRYGNNSEIHSLSNER